MDAFEHFSRRAAYYDRSSRWCTSPELAELTVKAVDPAPSHQLLDIACGTGLVSRLFKGRVQQVVGLDLTPAMAEQARNNLDQLVIGFAEALPFADTSFDRVVCRQGIQFMDDQKAVSEMVVTVVTNCRSRNSFAEEKSGSKKKNRK